MSDSVSVYFGGHSLGGAMVVDYVSSNVQIQNISGLLLNGAFIPRKYKTAVTSHGRPQVAFPVPTLTIGAELDGLCRLFRITEALYSQVTFSADPSQARHYLPVTVIPGMNHGQFANASGLPDFVLNHDIPAESSTVSAVTQAAADAAAFFTALQLNGSWTKLDERQLQSTDLTQPIVDALLLEGYWNFLPPCLCESFDEYGYRQYGTCVDQPNCTGGSPWTTQYTQTQLAPAIPGLTLHVEDSFHHVNEEKPSAHLPHIHGAKANNATPGSGVFPPLCPEPNGCQLNITTVTENWYSYVDQVADTGFYPQSAHELRTKLKSRQAIYNAAGIQNVTLLETDIPISTGGAVDLCAEVNKKSLNWALQRAQEGGSSFWKRYNDSDAMKLRIGPDLVTCIAGPCWIDTPLKFVPLTFEVQVESTVMVTNNTNSYPCGEDRLLPCDAGFHYCKILSPARALEYIVTDALQPKSAVKWY